MENYFILLELPFDLPESDTNKISEAISKKQAQWSRDQSNPVKKAKASEYLADLVKEKTDGHITLEYYGQNQLDCYAESVAQAHNGAVWMGLEEPSYFADYIGDYNVLVGPMLYKNNAEYNAVMDSVNLEEVREKAMDDLGMVYANENQVVEYDNPDGDYIKQYEQIPDEGVVASSAKTNE